MAQFYASIQGSQGEATRTGDKSSGIIGHIRGWNAGFRVCAWHDHESGEDCLSVFATGGSNEAKTEVKVAEIRGNRLIQTPIRGKPDGWDFT